MLCQNEQQDGMKQSILAGRVPLTYFGRLLWVRRITPGPCKPLRGPEGNLLS